jgi:hypothetical protein
MAIIISYPSAGTVTNNDNLLGTQFDAESGANITKNFSVGSIVNLAVETATAGGWNGTFQSNGTAVPGSGAGIYRMTIVNGIITTVALEG